jgi:hypothetical protein
MRCPNSPAVNALGWFKPVDVGDSVRGDGIIPPPDSLFLSPIMDPAPAAAACFDFTLQ